MFFFYRGTYQREQVIQCLPLETHSVEGIYLSTEKNFCESLWKHELYITKQNIRAGLIFVTKAPIGIVRVNCRAVWPNLGSLPRRINTEIIDYSYALRSYNAWDVLCEGWKLIKMYENIALKKFNRWSKQHLQLSMKYKIGKTTEFSKE